MKKFAGPSEPGRGSIGKTKAGLPTKLPRLLGAAAAVVPSKAGLKPLPRLLVAVRLSRSRWHRCRRTGCSAA